MTPWLSYQSLHDEKYCWKLNVYIYFQFTKDQVMVICVFSTCMVNFCLNTKKKIMLLVINMEYSIFENIFFNQKKKQILAYFDRHQQLIFLLISTCTLTEHYSNLYVSRLTPCCMYKQFSH